MPGGCASCSYLPSAVVKAETSTARKCRPGIDFVVREKECCRQVSCGGRTSLERLCQEASTWTPYSRPASSSQAQRYWAKERAT
jgi:hypothetical protein